MQKQQFDNDFFFRLRPLIAQTFTIIIFPGVSFSIQNSNCTRLDTTTLHVSLAGGFWQGRQGGGRDKYPIY